MNDDHDPAGAGDVEEALVRSLERRAGGVAPVRLSLDAIRRSAARRRRTRTVGLAGAAVGAVAAVAVVLALLPGAGDPSDRPPTAPTGAPSRPPAPTTPPTASPSPALSDVPRGDAPEVGVLVDGVLTEPDGSSLVVPPEAYDPRLGVLGVTRAGDDLLVADPLAFEGSNRLSLVEGGLATELGPCTSGTGAAGSDGLAAWVTFSCPESGVPAPTTLVRRAADGTTTSVPLDLPDDENVMSTAVGVLGDLVVVDRAFDAGVVLVDDDGDLDPVPGLTRTTAVSADGRSLVADLVGGGPTAVVDARSGQVRWRAPDLVAFSPAGDQVVSSRRAALTVRDTSTGRATATLTAPDGVRLLSAPVWEDDTHLLVVAEDDTSRSVLRLGVDGAVQRAGPALPDRGQVLLVP